LRQKSAGLTGAGWHYDEETDTFYIEDGANVRLTNRTTTSRIVIEENAVATLTLQDASIDLHETDWMSPIRLENGADVTVKLSGESSLKGSLFAGGGIEASKGTWLTITSEEGDGETGGKLTVTGGYGAAAQGGGYCLEGGTILIKGGNIHAIGTDTGAAIGGGWYYSGGSITIEGGIVVAEGGNFAAGIGGAVPTVQAALLRLQAER
jgi:hypothetical protein